MSSCSNIFISFNKVVKTKTYVRLSAELHNFKNLGTGIQKIPPPTTHFLNQSALCATLIQSKLTILIASPQLPPDCGGVSAGQPLGLHSLAAPAAALLLAAGASLAIAAVEKCVHPAGFKHPIV